MDTNVAPDKQKLKAFIKKHIAARGITQKQLSQKLKVAPPRLSQILSARRDSGVSFELLFRVLVTLGMTPTIVVGESLINLKN